MKYTKQLSFIPKAQKEFGGNIFLGKRKTKRPLSFKKPMHFVFKSEKAKNKLAFIAYQKRLIEIFYNLSKTYNVKVYDLAVNFNHIHCVVRLTNETQYKSWIKHLTSAIVDFLSKITKEKLEQFFTLRPYSKIIEWGRHFRTVLDYQILNKLEVVGLRPTKNSEKSKKRGAL